MFESKTKVSLVIHLPSGTSSTLSSLDISASNANLYSVAKAINSLQEVSFDKIEKVTLYRIGS